MECCCAFGRSRATSRGERGSSRSTTTPSITLRYDCLRSLGLGGAAGDSRGDRVSQRATRSDGFEIEEASLEDVFVGGSSAVRHDDGIRGGSHIPETRKPITGNPPTGGSGWSLPGILVVLFG
jgi:hypothetical protein